MNSTAAPSRFSRKKVITIVVVLLALIGLAAAGWTFSRKSASRSLTPAETKELIASYLEEKTGKSDFKTSLDVSKERNPWNLLKVQYDAPPDYKTVYRAIGEHLFIAENLINGSTNQQHTDGFRIIAELIEVANDVAYDPWLGARICDAYLVGQIDKAEENPKHGPSREQFLQIAGRAYKNAEEDDKLIDLGKLYLSKYPSGARADDIRRRLVWLLQNKGRKKEAEVYLSQIKSPQTADKANRRMGRTTPGTGQQTNGR